MAPIIRADGLSKQYDLAPRAAYNTFRDQLAYAVRSPRAWWRRAATEPMWALRDVSFAIEPGTVTGLIGRNGAGKSTLLKILSRITPPTSGEAVLCGRIASLLEVGTGFHPELTGRHNVFLNGAILGMRQREIARNFDAIVAFADVERFIDTPVKYYSTGMYLRLAFAVAAHLEAEILAVDEVLAVGDLVFQRKCLGKMAEVARSGRTVLLVSHNMAAVQKLSDEVLLLEGGRLAAHGRAPDVITRFVDQLQGGDDGTESSDLRALPRGSREHGGFTEGYLNGRPLVASHTLRTGGDLDFELVLDLPEPRRNCHVGINLDDDFGVRIWSLHSQWQVPRFDLSAGTHRFRCHVPMPPLVSGQYHIGVEAGAGRERLDQIDRAAILHVVQTAHGPTGETPGREHGYILAPAEWTVVCASPQPVPTGGA
ncbi:MAG: ABC transporter ATP-binding protein [Vicinamibacterales bacterium]